MSFVTTETQREQSFCVVVTARFGGMDAGETIEALVGQVARRCEGAKVEVYLVGDVDCPAEHADNIIHVRDDNPIRARNEAVQRCTADLILFIDADCVPADDWIDALTSAFVDDVVGVKGVYKTAQKHLIARLVQAEYERKYRRLEEREQIDFIDTYSAAYRRDVLVANDSFDEKFPYLEDQELSFRLASRGYRLIFRPSAIVYRHHADSHSQYTKKKFSIGYWKAQVVRRFPTRGVNDSYTPQVMKVQVALMGLALILLGVGVWFPAGWVAGLTLVVLFFVTTLPFAGWLLSRDRWLAVRLPFLLTLRAVALGMGYVWGLVRPVSMPNDETISGFDYVAKRGMDIVGGLVGCTILAAVLPVLALAIKLDSKGNLFFEQVRIGEQGRPFTVYKFRSMVSDAEAQLDELIDVEALDEPVFKLDDDPRVTKVGHFIRRWSLDELPQFWNVLKGEMSLVGPRPEESRMVALYNDYQRRRLAVKPGITGPMQVNGRGDLSLNERVALEIDYIQNYSVWEDVKILLRTFPAVLGGDGAR